jgi:integrase
MDARNGCGTEVREKLRCSPREQNSAQLPLPVLPKKLWPKVEYGEKRAIKQEEHLAILAHEKNIEKNQFWNLSWHLGASQTDMAWLHGEDINWRDHTIFYRRRKSKSASLQRFGKKVEAILRTLPTSGPLFPHMKELRASDRATEFKRACKRASVKGVTHHCYRYAWAERALTAGYEERYAQAALGHGSKAVARVYAKKAPLVLPRWRNTRRKTGATMSYRCQISASMIPCVQPLQKFDLRAGEAFGRTDRWLS